jgi:hypothetical protein
MVQESNGIKTYLMNRLSENATNGTNSDVENETIVESVESVAGDTGTGSISKR